MEVAGRQLAGLLDHQVEYLLCFGHANQSFEQFTKVLQAGDRDRVAKPPAHGQQGLRDLQAGKQRRGVSGRVRMADIDPVRVAVQQKAVQPPFAVVRAADHQVRAGSIAQPFGGAIEDDTVRLEGGAQASIEGEADDTAAFEEVVQIAVSRGAPGCQQRRRQQVPEDQLGQFAAASGQLLEQMGQAGPAQPQAAPLRCHRARRQAELGDALQQFEELRASQCALLEQSTHGLDFRADEGPHAVYEQCLLRGEGERRAHPEAIREWECSQANPSSWQAHPSCGGEASPPGAGPCSEALPLAAPVVYRSEGREWQPYALIEEQTVPVETAEIRSRMLWSQEFR
ncbi:hypothetical protein D9M70_423480 [compost metagenome]